MRVLSASPSVTMFTLSLLGLVLIVVAWIVQASMNPRRLSLWFLVLYGLGSVGVVWDAVQAGGLSLFVWLQLLILLLIIILLFRRQ